MVVEVSGWNALDALAAPANAPLPSLSHQTIGMFKTMQSQNEEAGNDNDNDDYFEDFAGFNNTSSYEAPLVAVGPIALGAVPAAEASGWDAYSSLPSLSHQSPGMVNKKDDDIISKQQ
jgi:hypothetical protein